VRGGGGARARSAVGAGLVLLSGAAAFVAPRLGGQVAAQESPGGGAVQLLGPAGREILESLDTLPLEFSPPRVEEREIRDVDVMLLEDHTLPLVTFYAYFRGGYGLFDRSHYGAAMGLPALMRYGGTTLRTPIEVDETIQFYALQTTFGSGGGSVTTSINTLVEHVDTALALWGELLARPAFAEDEILAWRDRQLEAVRRRADDPARLAFREMNRLLYGDHPVGWEMNTSDLMPERLTADRFRSVHARVVCRDNLVMGVTGDVDWIDIRPKLDLLVSRIPDCLDDLPEPPKPEIRRGGGVFVVEKEIEQAVIVMAHPTDVRLEDDEEYFSAMIGNSILGGGGFSSRILRRVRTERGFAYSATSLWTTPRLHEGIVGAITRTGPEHVVEAVELILGTMSEMRERAPDPGEVRTTVDGIVNGFVFNFDSPAQIVSRSVFYRAQELPEDWLSRYLDGVRGVTPLDVQRVFATHLRPEEMTILVVGDPDRIGRDALATLGPVRTLSVR